MSRPLYVIRVQACIKRDILFGLQWCPADDQVTSLTADSESAYHGLLAFITIAVEKGPI